MKTERHSFQVQSATPPTLEIDTQASSVYVRFKRAVVAKTISNESKFAHFAVDLNSRNEVIGIEAVGVREFSLTAILRRAKVTAPRLDVSKARYISAELATAGGASA